MNIKLLKGIDWRKTALVLSLVAACSIALTWWADRRIESDTDSAVFTVAQDVPCNRVGLLLGTSQYLKSGRPNLYFTYRIEAAVALFEAGKVERFIVSGDNSRKDYNEPEAMQMALMAAGIPTDRIHLDFAGFRTFDSVVRAEKVFGQRSFTVISQDFHNRRAIYIAQQLGLDAVGFNARDVNAYYGLRTRLRERLARVKVFMDMLLGKGPKFLGDPVVI
ncbi:MAG: YdcF family protein [Flavobacteriales bacterium]|nr:YdcF family protein [Flavobacteriales bacterium]